MAKQVEVEVWATDCSEGEHISVTDCHQILRVGGKTKNKMTLRTLDCSKSDRNEYKVSERPSWLCENCKLYGIIRSGR